VNAIVRVAVLLVAYPLTAHAQTTVGVWFSAALDSRTQTRVAHDDPWDFYQAGVRLDTPLLSGPVVSLDFSPDFIPLALTTRNPAYTTVSSPTTPSCFCAVTEAVSVTQRVTRHTTFAFGAAPLGAALHINRHRFVEITVDARGGGLWFTSAVPDPNAARLNFTAAGGVGLTLAQRVMLGYAYEHASNGGLGQINPGINTHLLYAGILLVRS
jgi:hypothetical protein